ncbi:ribose import ATP-binding protein RbsA [Actinoplanes sp. OR16]|uniref:sugar ABC transporter ATP-binding protein n=1 Tax=Actinoplanes sp. OR16 TaxID=946334 RepID=UPI000F714817|nr:sugar ABC transporter ATP-binding protein [Actinoplanes sp. OR16]BBH71118.1 ribose import ATP-binding protein RbsA [Actinoplanes sp. OR16]
MIRVEGVTKSFGGAAALTGVTVEFLPGEVHALMGMNGAGKSTLVQILSGALHPDSGVLEVGGHVQAHLNPRQARRAGIFTVPQRRELVMGLTVAENIMLGDLPTSGSLVRWREVRETAQAALTGLGIAIDADAVAGDLTVAEQTMVEVAREVRRGGKVLILDEPTACLGPEAAQQIRDLVLRLRDSGVAVVFISHHISEVLALADRITVLRDGRVTWAGLATETDEKALVRDMVGRDVVSRRPARPACSSTIAIAVRGLADGRFMDGFDIDVRCGEIVAVLGPAGDAQSRLFDLLSGRRKADRGSVEVAGKKLKIGNVRHSLASGLRCVTGDRRRLGLIPGLTVDENVMLAQDRLDKRRIQRWSRLTGRAAPLREKYRVVSLAKNPPVEQLSGGNQQKVLLAKWLGTNPRAVLLEDPTNGVDVSAMAEIHALVDRLAGEGAAVLLASSSAEEVMRLADRVVVVRDGRRIAEYEVDRITRDELIAATLGGTL